MLKNKEKGILCTLDIEKAYDHIDWSFLLDVLRKMAFGERWVNWIFWCISSSSFSALSNGSPTRFVRSSRGLKQGNPLSPYLFVLDMEVLSGLIDKAASGGYIFGISSRAGLVRKGRSIIFYSQKTLLVFCRDSENQMTYLFET